jgi:subtilisin family serine protease
VQRVSADTLLSILSNVVRVAVIDSGVHASHPHIRGVAGGVTIGEELDEKNYTDVIGHGTAVIKEKAPDAEYFAVRVFYSSLRTTVDLMLRAIEWSIAHKVDAINLSLGT